MKSEKGITLAVLVITIVLMLILASVSISIGTNSLDSTRLKGFYTQLEIIQKRVDDIATTNESYIDKNGDTIYLKEKGSGLTFNQETLLKTDILPNEIPEINLESLNLRYFTVSDLEKYFDLSDIDYNVFIDFDKRIIIAEDGIKIGDTTYHVLKNATYFVQQNKDKNKAKNLIYTVGPRDETGKYIVTVNVNPTDTGTVKYKKVTDTDWIESGNREISLEASLEYKIIYIDVNSNNIEKTIKVVVDSSGVATVKEIDFSYPVTPYGTNQYKVVITPNNTIGDIGGTGYVKYKKTTRKYWEVSDNTEIIIEADVEYNIVYIDANNNKSEEKTIKVVVDSDTGVATVTEI